MPPTPPPTGGSSQKCITYLLAVFMRGGLWEQYFSNRPCLIFWLVCHDKNVGNSIEQFTVFRTRRNCTTSWIFFSITLLLIDFWYARYFLIHETNIISSFEAVKMKIIFGLVLLLCAALVNVNAGKSLLLTWIIPSYVLNILMYRYP